MGHGEDSSLAQYWKDLPTADTEQKEWLKGARISLEDLTRGSARVERLTAKGWWSAAGQRGEGGASGGGNNTPNGRGVSHTGAVKKGVARAGGTAGKPADKGPLRFSFGKYKNELVVDVREEDPSYFEWVLREVDWFAKKIREAGLDKVEVAERSGKDVYEPKMPNASSSFYRRRADNDWAEMETAAENMNPDDPYENGSWCPNR